MKIHLVALFAIGIALAAPATARADIIQPDGTQFENIGFFAPFGQSFIAVDSLIGTVGVKVVQFHDVPDPFTITYSLYEGVGAHGTPIASRTFTGVGDFLGFGDVSFAGVSLVVGNTYSLMLTQQSKSDSFAFESPFNPYASGALIANNQADPTFDLTFHILAASSTAPTPEPATTALLALGLAAAGARRLRTRA